jgi:soluble lytic murein transglycosylase-like protein
MYGRRLLVLLLAAFVVAAASGVRAVPAAEPAAGAAAADRPAIDAAAVARVRIPSASVGYRLQVERAAAAEFGLSASPARLAAQIHQESAWRPTAQSAYALGLAQFTPATAEWLPKVCPDLWGFDPWDASQSIRAAACYDRWLYDRVAGTTECDHWAFTLSAYNGGLGWVRRDVVVTSASGADDMRWFGHVENYSPRAKWAIRENRDYVRRILLLLEPAYLQAGWDGALACP